jgi:hypothetical protein
MVTMQIMAPSQLDEKLQVMDKLDILERDLLLPHYQDWTVIEDRERSLKAQVRLLFSEWVAGASVEKDRPGVDEKRVRKLPRFSCCVYVD